MRTLRAVTALAALIVLTIGWPWALVRLFGNPWPAEGVSLTRPLSDAGLIGLIAAVLWLLWAIQIACVVLEARDAISEIRGVRSANRFHGFGPQRQLARVLVWSVAALVVTTPALAAAVTAAPAATASTSPLVGEVPDAALQVDDVVEDEQVRHESVSYTVMRGDTLWAIAERCLGDGQRWKEIRDLNEGRAMGDGRFFKSADLIFPGWVIALPAGAIITETDQVIVEVGDTLSAIALAALGDADRFPEIFEASKEIEQPGGARLVDPDHIEPGWTLNIRPPVDVVAPALPLQDGGGRDPSTPVVPSPASADGSTSEIGTAPSLPTGTHEAGDYSVPADPAETPESAAGWVLPGLLGAGGLLAAGALIGLRQRRAAGRRHREPGRVPEPVAPELVDVENSLTHVGADHTHVLHTIRESLRHLAARLEEHQHPAPALAAVEVTNSAIAVHLKTPATPPIGWRTTDDDLVWFIERSTAEQLEAFDGREDPWPLLVTIGHDDRDSVWLLNLEDTELVLDGDDAAVADFSRFVAAEVACNPWSQHATVDLYGVAGEVAPMNPDRLRVVDDLDQASSDAVAHAVAGIDRLDADDTSMATSRVLQRGGEVWPAHLLVVAAGARSAQLSQIQALIRAHPGRSASALLRHGSDDAGLQVHITSDRLLSVTAVGLTLTAVGLNPAEASGIAALLRQADVSANTPAPDLVGNANWRRFATTTGALRDQYTLPRGATPIESAASLLPQSDDTYLEAAATRAIDLEALAPQVTSSTSVRVLEADPELEADLEDWRSQTTTRPKLRLLGQVEARTSATLPPALTKRRRYFAELAAYLATTPHGATSAQIGDNFDLAAGTVRARTSDLRKFLGADDDGNAYLTYSRDDGRYRIPSALVDIDLFRRLRIRGEASGPGGIEDLIAALELVAGRPFEQASSVADRADGRFREGFRWLTANPVDQHMVCAIADVAHLVVTYALADANTALARRAVEIALMASDGAPEEVTRLDLSRVVEAEGNPEEADRIIRDQIVSRSDEGDAAPEDLPTRTEQVLASQRLRGAI